jgi:hypothetical protein
MVISLLICCLARGALQLLSKVTSKSGVVHWNSGSHLLCNAVLSGEYLTIMHGIGIMRNLPFKYGTSGMSLH